MQYLSSSDAVVLSNKIVAPAEAISVSMVESCCQKDHETIVASGAQTTGQIDPSTKGMLKTIIVLITIIILFAFWMWMLKSVLFELWRDYFSN